MARGRWSSMMMSTGPWSGEVGFVCGHLDRQLGIATGLADGVAMKGP
jgi:hypothetical protein